MKRRLILFALAALVCLPVALPARAAPAAGDLLRAMVEAEKSLSYSGTAQITRRQGAPVTMKVWRSGEKRRMEWTAPPVMRGDLLVDDGASVWRYHRAENSAVQTRGAARIDWARLGRTMETNLSGGGEVAGRAAWIVALTPRGQNLPTLKVWIDQANHARLRLERLNAAGQSVETATLQDVRFGGVPASQFQWSPPPGASVTRTGGTLYGERSAAERAASWLQIPGYVPAGYTFESAVIDPGGAGGLGEAWLRYANGLNRFSIFQQRTTEKAAVAAQRAGDGWFMQRGGSRFLVIGLPDGEARKVIESLR